MRCSTAGDLRCRSSTSKTAIPRRFSWPHCLPVQVILSESLLRFDRTFTTIKERGTTGVRHGHPHLDHSNGRGRPAPLSFTFKNCGIGDGISRERSFRCQSFELANVSTTRMPFYLPIRFISNSKPALCSALSVQDR